MRRRYDPNQLELFPEFVNQDISQDSKRARGNPQRRGGWVPSPQSNRGVAPQLTVVPTPLLDEAFERL